MWHHTAYAHHVYHAHAAGSWLGHTIVSAVIHGLVYGAIFHFMRGMSIGEVLLVTVIGVALAGGGWWLWNRLSTGRRF